MILVEMSGGIGTKLWPSSGPECPKHLIPDFFEGTSLFQLNLKILRQGFGVENIVVQTTSSQSKLVAEQAEKYGVKEVWVEPELRNHGPAMVYLAARLMAEGRGEETFSIVQADLLRRPAKEFVNTLKLIDKLVQEEGRLVTGGIRATHAIPGVDFLNVGEAVGRSDRVYFLDSWLLRGEKDKIQESLEAGTLFSHFNHYSWTARLFLESLNQFPEWGVPKNKLVEAFAHKAGEEEIGLIYATLPKEPAEHYTTRMARQMLVVDLPFGCSDVGTWASVVALQKEGHKVLPNHPEAQVVEVDARGNSVFARDSVKVALVGVEGLTVVVEKGKVLVMGNEGSTRVGEVPKVLK